MRHRGSIMGPVPLEGGMFVYPARAAEEIGLTCATVSVWANHALTSYGYPLNVIEYQGHRLIDERDVRVMAMVQRHIPVMRSGPPSRERSKQMKEYASKLRAALDRPVKPAARAVSAIPGHGLSSRPG